MPKKPRLADETSRPASSTSCRGARFQWQPRFFVRVFPPGLEGRRSLSLRPWSSNRMRPSALHTLAIWRSARTGSGKCRGSTRRRRCRSFRPRREGSRRARQGAPLPFCVRPRASRRVVPQVRARPDGVLQHLAPGAAQQVPPQASHSQEFLRLLCEIELPRRPSVLLPDLIRRTTHRHGNRPPTSRRCRGRSGKRSRRGWRT